MSDHRVFETLLMKAVDDRLTPADRALLAGHLDRCARCREELADFRRIKGRTDALRERIMRDAMIIPPREGRGRRRLVLVATGLLAAGLLSLLGVAAHEFFTDGEVPLIVKVSVSLLAGGTALLAGLAVGQRLRGRGRDPYQEIDL